MKPSPFSAPRLQSSRSLRLTLLSIALFGALFAGVAQATCSSTINTYTCSSPPTDSAVYDFSFNNATTGSATNWTLTAGHLYAYTYSGDNTFTGNNITATTAGVGGTGVIHIGAMPGSTGNVLATVNNSSIQAVTLNAHGIAAHANNTVGNATLNVNTTTVNMAASTGGYSGLVVVAQGTGKATLNTNAANVTTANTGVSTQAVSVSGSTEANLIGGTITSTGNGSTGLYTAAGGAGTLTIGSSAAITTSGDNAPGIYAQAAGGAITVTNSGAVITDGQSSTGIYAINPNAGAITVTNNSDIHIKGSQSDGILSITNAGSTIKIVNNGNILHDAATPLQYGIEVRGASSNAITIQNDGRVEGSEFGLVAWTDFAPHTGSTSITNVGSLGVVDALYAISTDMSDSNTINIASGGRVNGKIFALNLRSRGTSTPLYTVNNAGLITSDRDQLLRTQLAVAGATIAINNQASGVMTGYMLSDNATVTVNNPGVWNIRNFADTNVDAVRDTQSVAMSNFGTSGANAVINSGTIALLPATGAATLDTTGQYLPLGYTVNATSLNGPVQGQLLGDATFTNSGTIDMQANNVAGDVLVISGGQTPGSNGSGVYNTGGTLKLDTVANAGGAVSQSDILVVDSTQIGAGPTALSINMTGAGAQTTGDGILVVQVLGSSAAGSFSMSPITVGGYTYSLYQGGVGGANPNNWYLRSSPPTLTLTKTTAAATVTPGGTVTYTVTLTNSGTGAASNIVVTDPIPAGIASATWTCAGAACPAPSGTGAINQTITSLPASGVVTYTVTATISASPPASVINTASATVPNGVCAPGNTAVPCTASAPVPPVAVVQMNKTAGTNQATPGGTVTYTVTTTNTSAVSAAGATISDPIPAGLTAYTWTCTGTGGAVCPNASGSGALNQTIATFPGNSALTYQITATVSANPPTTITNTAISTVPGGGLCAPGNTPSPCSTSSSISGQQVPVPALSTTLLGLLALVLAVCGATYRRRLG